MSEQETFQIYMDVECELFSFIDCEFIPQDQIMYLDLPSNNEMKTIVNQPQTELSGDNIIGAYSPKSRREKIKKFLDKRSRRNWTRKVKYEVRKKFADSRKRIRGRFIKKRDEETLLAGENLS